jgi:two-component system OmpR family sensor kinase
MVSVIQRGLFWRVYLTLMGSLLLAALLAAIFSHWAMAQPMRAAMNVPRAALAALLPPPGSPPSQTAAVVTRLSAALGGRVMLTGADGRLVAAAPARALAQPRGRAPRVWRLRLADGRVLAIETPAPRGGPHILVVLLIIAGAVGLAAYPIVARLTGRLERLRASLDAWGGGQLDRRAQVEGRDEIAAVAASFNAAADRIEALLAAHKALLAHASHELRSPLTRLRVAVEMFLASPDPGLQPGIVRDIAELDGLVEEILLASRLDQAQAAPERERVDCLALAAEEAARTGALVRPVEPGAGPFEVLGSARLLRRLIRNLIENAHKHGQPPVEVALARTGQGAAARVRITVHDQGPGIPEAERDRVFEPFYRPSGRAEAAGSWGLGLSIVRQIAERHGGTASCAADGFTVVLPAANLG